MKIILVEKNLNKMLWQPRELPTLHHLDENNCKFIWYTKMFNFRWRSSIFIIRENVSSTVDWILRFIVFAGNDVRKVHSFFMWRWIVIAYACSDNYRKHDKNANTVYETVIIICFPMVFLRRHIVQITARG